PRSNPSPRATSGVVSSEGAATPSSMAAAFPRLPADRQRSPALTAGKADAGAPRRSRMPAQARPLDGLGDPSVEPGEDPPLLRLGQAPSLDRRIQPRAQAGLERGLEAAHGLALGLRDVGERLAGPQLFA